MSQASSGNRKLSLRLTSALVVAATLIVAPPFISSASAQVMNYAPAAQSAFPPDDDVMAAPRVRENMDAALPERLRRAEVGYMTREAPGTVIIDTGNTQLYYVLGNNRAIRYGVGV